MTEQDTREAYPSKLQLASDEPDAILRALNNAYVVIADSADEDGPQDAVGNCVLHEILRARAALQAREAPQPAVTCEQFIAAMFDAGWKDTGDAQHEGATLLWQQVVGAATAPICPKCKGSRVVPCGDGYSLDLCPLCGAAPGSATAGPDALEGTLTPLSGPSRHPGMSDAQIDAIAAYELPLEPSSGGKWYVSGAAIARVDIRSFARECIREASREAPPEPLTDEQIDAIAAVELYLCPEPEPNSGRFWELSAWGLYGKVAHKEGFREFARAILRAALTRQGKP